MSGLPPDGGLGVTDLDPPEGILDDSTELSPRDPGEPAWEDVDDAGWHARRMEVYAAQVEAIVAVSGR